MGDCKIDIPITIVSNLSEYEELLICLKSDLELLWNFIENTEEKKQKKYRIGQCCIQHINNLINEIRDFKINFSIKGE